MWDNGNHHMINDFHCQQHPHNRRFRAARQSSPKRGGNAGCRSRIARARLADRETKSEQGYCRSSTSVILRVQATGDKLTLRGNTLAPEPGEDE